MAAVLHAPVRLVLESMCFVAYQGDDHAVEVEEEHDEVEAEFDEGFLERGGWSAMGIPDCYVQETNLFVDVQFAEYLGCVEEMLVVENPDFCHAISPTLFPS